jgi:hypothetical protein
MTSNPRHDEKVGVGPKRDRYPRRLNGFGCHTLLPKTLGIHQPFLASLPILVADRNIYPN